MHLGLCRWMYMVLLILGMTWTAPAVWMQSWVSIPFSQTSFHQLAGFADPHCSPAGFLGRSSVTASWSWFGVASSTTPLICDSFPNFSTLVTCGTRGAVPFGNLGLIQWVGTDGEGVFGRSTDTVLHFSPSNAPLPDGTIRQLQQRNDTLWMATAGGLARIHGGTWKTWTLADGLAASHITDLAFLPDGSIAFASINGGLSFLRADTLSEILDNHNSWLPDNTLTGIEVTSDGQVWLSFTTAGLVLWQQGGPIFFQTQNGAIPSNGIRQLSSVDFPSPGVLAATESAGILWLDASGVVSHWPGGGSFPFAPDEILWVRGATFDFPFHMAASLRQVYIYPLGNHSVEEIIQGVVHHGNWSMPQRGRLTMLNHLGQICFSRDLEAGESIPRPGAAGVYFLQIGSQCYRKLWLD